MAYTRGVDVIGKSLMDALSGLGADWATKIQKDRQDQQTSDQMGKIFPPPTVDPNAGAVPIPGTPGMIPIPSVTSGPPPFAMQNVENWTKLHQINPDAAQTAWNLAKMNEPSESTLAPGATMVERQPPWMSGGVKALYTAPSKPEKDNTVTAHLTTQIDPTDRPTKQGGTGKLMQPEYQATADPTTGISSYIHQAGYDPVRGKTDPAYEKQMRVINNMKDMTPPGAGGAGKWIVGQKNALGKILNYINLTTNEVKTPQDLGLPETENPLTNTTKTMIETAGNVKSLANEALSIVNNKDKTGELGPVASRWRDFSAGTVGASDPEFMRFRTIASDLLPTLLMRMHMGARGGEKIMEKFTGMMGADHQTPENLRAVLGEISNYADMVSSEQHGVKDNTVAPNTPPPGAKVRKFNAATGAIE